MKRSIHELQDALRNAVERSLESPIKDTHSEALRLLIPNGYRLRVELRENGRKKRNDANAERWSPEAGEIVIHCIAGDGTGIPERPSEKTDPATRMAATSADATRELRELCGTLAETESAGRSFIALKWFRDSVLAEKEFSWAKSAEGRQAVLAKAIEQGAVITKKILNPRAPQFPTTTIALSRSHSPQLPQSRRYAPISIKGEPLSETLLRDRGVR